MGSFHIVAVYFQRREPEYAEFTPLDIYPTGFTLIPIAIGMRELHISCSIRYKPGDKWRQLEMHPCN